MYYKFSFSILILCLININLLFSQGFRPPAEGKAVVYFTRVSKYGGAASFEYFHKDKYIGSFKWENYLRYECEPGKQLFWISSENKCFIDADLKAGATYIVLVDIKMGWMKARAGLNPITVDDKDKFDRAKRLINSNPPVVTPEKQIEKMNIKLKEKISENLRLYEERWKNADNTVHIAPDMAIPKDFLK